MIVTKVRFEDRIIELCSNDVDKENNLFTLIIGRNGYGKSTLLQKICHIGVTSLLKQNGSHQRIRDLIDYDENTELTSFDETGSLTYITQNVTNEIVIEKPIFIPPNINLNEIPEHLHASIIESFQNEYFGRKVPLVRYNVDGIRQENMNILPRIIAVSSSPFDKFPILDERRLHSTLNPLKNHYIYRGARTKDRSSKSYMRSKFDQLGSSFIDFFLKPENRTNEILPLFSYLGIETKFTVFLKFPDHFSFRDVLTEGSRGPLEAVRSVRFFKGKGHDESLTDEDRERIVSSVKSLKEGLFPDSKSDDFHRRDELFSINLDIDSLDFEKPEYLKEFSVLAEYDLVDIANIEFIKKNDKRKFFITEASSGELCILFNMLSIAGSIKDESIVLLDEPELSLHPEWQRDFLPLLAKVFSKYKRCHFIIATHSPHVVSSIPKSNSFVVNLESNPAKVIAGEKLALHSSDYQLACTFRSPGFKNEYLISQLVEVLSNLSEGKKLDESFIDKINELIEFDLIVPDNDPVKNLLSTLKKALAVLIHE
jgi:predicted ATPase